MTVRVRIGVDLGGTKIEAVALGRDGHELVRRRIPTPRDDYDGTLAAIAGLVESIEEDVGSPGVVGIGMPGSMSRVSGLVKNANSVWLNGRPLAQDLAKVLPRPLRFANDANCFALSEAIDGAAAGHRVVFGVILGTGVGGGLALDGRAWDGLNGVSGEWGHNPLPWPRDDERPGPPCYCGKTGCLETFLSGPGLARDHARVTGQRASAAEIAERAFEGNAEAEDALARYEDRLARGLASVVNVVDPEAIVLGGGLSQIGRLYERIPDLLPRYVFSDTVATPVLSPRHGDSSGVRGAARLWSLEEI
ncbi:MAG TPA: ROK family protein [Vicinamibacteria bacterium]|nr:ROK family protein [Vicinamibacteria bacterium]